MNGFKKMLFGEKMPDKDDPQYADRYKKEVEAGKKFAQLMKIDVFFAKLQVIAVQYRRFVLFLIFSFVVIGFSLSFFNIYNLVRNRPTSSSAIKLQEKALQSRRDTVHIINEKQEINQEEKR